MAIKLYFGLPGCGKTTHLARTAYRALKHPNKPYKNVYCNVYLGRTPPFDKIIYIDSEDLGKYDISDGLILIDEATLAFHSRDFKSFSKEKLLYFVYHRHFRVDLCLYSQSWDSTDLRIREMIDRCYYIYKKAFWGKWFSNYYRIPYGIIIPDPKKDKGSGNKLGEIVQGYCKPSIITRLLQGGFIYRPKYYKYFNSWWRPDLPPLPDRHVIGDHISSNQKEGGFSRRRA